MISHLPNDHFGGPDEETIRRGHELDRVSLKAVVITAIVLAVAVGGSLYFVSFLEAKLNQSAPQAEVPRAWQRVERPPVDYDQPAQLRALRAWESRTLEEFQWQDDEKTIAAIPVERAIEIVAKKGLPFGSSSDGAAGAEESQLEPRAGGADEDADAGDRTKKVEGADPTGDSKAPAEPSPPRAPDDEDASTESDAASADESQAEAPTREPSAGDVPADAESQSEDAGDTGEASGNDADVKPESPSPPPIEEEQNE